MKGLKTGGRKAGTPNGERRELYELLKEKYPDYHPVIAMADIANNEENDIDLRFQANKEVSKYVCPQLKAVEITGDSGNQIVVKIIRDNERDTPQVTSPIATADSSGSETV